MPRTARDDRRRRLGARARSDMPRVLVRARAARAAAPRDRAADAERARRRSTPSTACSSSEFGIDFTHYKPSTVTRRIERRLALARIDDIDAVRRAPRGERDELDVLYRDLLIGVTRFFRDDEAFEFLEQQVLPELLAQRAPRRAAPRLGRRLRDRRGGVLARDPAARARRPSCGERAVQDLRDRRAPRLARARGARHLRRGRGRATSRRSGSSATSSRSGDELPGRARAPPDRRLRAAQRDQGRAVHARRSRQLPQPAHLPPAGRAAEGAVAVPLRAQPRRRAVPRAERERRARSRNDFETVDSTGASTASTATCASPVDPRLQPRLAERGAPAPPRAAVRALLARRSCSARTTRCSTTSCRRACSSTSAASSSTRSAARASS